MCWLTDREHNLERIERNNVGEPEERTLEKKNRKNHYKTIENAEYMIYENGKW